MYSHFVSYPGFCSTEWDQIQNGATLRVAYPILSIPCLLMPWRLKEPGHQQAWYWPNKPEYSVTNNRKLNWWPVVKIDIHSVLKKNPWKWRVVTMTAFVVSCVVSDDSSRYSVTAKTLFKCRSKKTPEPRATGLCEGNSSVTGEFLSRRTSNAENVSIGWRHHVHDQSARLHRDWFRWKLDSKSN